MTSCWLARRFCVNRAAPRSGPLSTAFSGAAAGAGAVRLGDWSLAGASTYLATRDQHLLQEGGRRASATHTIFIGEAETVNMHDPIEPLIYQDATYCFSVPHAARPVETAAGLREPPATDRL